MAEPRLTVTLVDVEVNAATDALLAIEAWDERVNLPGTHEHNRLAAIVLPLRDARDRALAEQPLPDPDRAVNWDG
jgi:hypothetical protein